MISGKHYEVSGTTVKKYYYSGGERVAERVEGSPIPAENGLYYLLTDHLGSTALALKEGGGSSEMHYDAYGEVRFANGSLPTRFTYTGQRAEEQLGISYFKARWYDTALKYKGCQVNRIRPNHSVLYSALNPLQKAVGLVLKWPSPASIKVSKWSPS